MTDTFTPVADDTQQNIPDAPLGLPEPGGSGSAAAATGDLAVPEPPSEADLAPLLATAGAQRVAERNAAVVDPQIPDRTRLLTGARLAAGNRGEDRATYSQWRQDRTQETPVRSGTDERQAKILAAPDSVEQGKAIGGESAVWLEATDIDPIDVARFDRAPKVGRAAELWEKMLAGRLDDDEAFALADLVTSTGEILGDFDDDLTLGDGRVVEVGDRVRVHFAREPAPGVVTALGLDSLPSDAFDGDVEGEGFDVLVGDDIVVSAPAESQPLLRRAFPAASTGGTPRWLTARPATVRGLMRAVEAAGVTADAHVAVHTSGHPGLAPYDSLTFTTESQRRADRFRALGAQHLGRGVEAVPRYARRMVSNDDLVDAPTADEMIDKTAWAIFDPDDELRLSDHRQLPVRSGDRDFVMVFGISPDEAAEATSGFAYVNDGVAIEAGYDGLEPFEADPAWFEVELRDGTTYTFPASREEAGLFPERTTRAVERWQIPLDDQNRPQVSGLAAHLETLDAGDIAAYTTGPAGEGFSEAREVLWGSVGNVAAARVAGMRSGPNVIPVWLRDTAGLPDDTALSPDLLDTDEAEAAAERVGSKWRYDARGYVDLAETARWGHALGQRYGYDNVEVVTDDGTLELVR